jgi:hypothetical protein
MYRLLIDTNIWIDLAGNFKEQPLLLVLEGLVREKKARLLVPSIVMKEFEAKREGTERAAAQRAASAFSSAKAVVELLGNSEDKKRIRELLADFGQKYPLVGEVPKFYVKRVQDLLAAGEQVEPSDSVKVRAATRAMEKRAPFHTSKNSINDAVLIEMYADMVRDTPESEHCLFVSKNHHDFSAPGESHKTPHGDIAAYFPYPRSQYFINLPDALEEIAPEELEEANYQASGLPEPRTFSEISDAIDLLWDQIWYNRHKVYEEKIADGRIKLVEKKAELADMFDLTTESKEVWAMAQDAAKRVETKRELENLGPWTDFEWGMLNGKMSALRWVLGDEWDFLDT